MTDRCFILSISMISLKAITSDMLLHLATIAVHSAAEVHNESHRLLGSPACFHYAAFYFIFL